MFLTYYHLNVRGGQDPKTKEDRIHTYFCPPSTPKGEIYDALYTMIQIIKAQIMESDKAEEKVAAEKNPREKADEECCDREECHDCE